ncbi:MAG: hypothetical protein VX899_08915 [Myxococcota bacterium]|nr:hypothetical protein [Myxococcota bacterium]
MDARQLLNLEIETEDGEVHGPMDVYLIRERIYAGRYRGKEQVRPVGGQWRSITAYEECAEVLALVGVDVEGMKIRDRQTLTGWKQAAPDTVTPRVEETGSPLTRPPVSEDPRVEAEKKPGGGLPIPLIIAGGAALVAAILAWVFLG